MALATAPVVESLEERRMLTSPDISNATLTGYWCGCDFGTNAPPYAMQPPDAGDNDNDQAPCDCDCGCNQDPAESDDDSSDEDSAESDYPVRYGDGKPRVSANDILSLGFGKKFGIIRTWGDRTDSGLTGPGWVFKGLPHLDQIYDNHATGVTPVLVHVTVVSAGMGQSWFDPPAADSKTQEVSPPAPPADSGTGASLPPVLLKAPPRLWNLGGGGYVLQGPTGRRTSFYGFSAGNVSGKFKEETDADGVVTSATYSGDGNYDEVVRTVTIDGTTTKESYKFTYIGSGLTNAGRLQSVTLRRKSYSGSEPAWNSGNDIRTVNYGYYPGSTPAGMLRTAAITTPGAATSVSISHSTTTATVTLASHGYAVGDLFTVSGATQGAYDGTFTVDSVVDANTFTYIMTDDPGATASGAPVVNRPFDVEHYRYYTNGTLKYVLDAASYARLDAAVADPLAAADGTVEPYAKYYFQYDALHRVTQEVAQAAGGGTFKFSYALNADADPDVTAIDYNFWRVKTTELLPDATPSDDTDNPRNIVYVNEVGQPMLKIYRDGQSGAMWGTFYHYDGSGHTDLIAHPSAVKLDPSWSTGLLSTGEVGTYDDLLHKVGGNYEFMNDTSGKVDLLDYYTSTTATSSTAGGAAGQLQDTKIQHGEFAVEAGKLLAAGALTRSGGTATVSLTAHGYANGDKILITGAAQSEYNGVFTITYVDANTFTFTVSGSPASPGTGPIVVYRTGKLIKLNQEKYIERDNGASGTNLVEIYPLAESTDYPNEDGTTGPRTTKITYTWPSSSSLHMDSRTVTLPAVNYTQNGPGTNGAATVTFFDALGRSSWTKDADGYIRYASFDPGSGALLKSIADVDTSQTSDFANKPSGWSTPSGAGLHLITSYALDKLGRTIQLTDPNGNNTFTVYNDANHETRTYPGFDGTNTTGPIQVIRVNRVGNYVESLTLALTPHLTSLVPDGTEAVSGTAIRSLSRGLLNSLGEVVEVDQYFDLTGVSYTTGTSLGTLGTNFYATQYGYDARGNQDKVVDTVGTITRTVYDGQRRVTSVWTGTSDAGWDPGTPAAMTKVAEYLYDTYDPALVVTGDSNLTRVIRDPGGGASARIDELYYDWRDRPVATKSGVLLNGSNQPDPTNEGTNVQRVVIYTTYDNLDEAKQTDQYDGDAVAMVASNAATDTNFDGIPDAPGTNKLRARMTADYDDLGRVWRSRHYKVSQTGVVSSNSLKSWNWYDQRGNLVRTLVPGGLTTKYTYDGAGRVVKQYQTDGGGDATPGSSGTWDNAITVTGDDVLEQTETQYDKNSNPIFSIHKLHFHDDTNTGELSNVSGTPKARVYVEAFYYDMADRLTGSADYGTNGGTPMTSRASSTLPTRSDTVLVNSYEYDDAGRLATATDPRAIASKTYYDLLGRTTKTIAGYADGTPSDGDDQTTLYTYDGMGHVLTMTADMPGGTNDQTTQYVYGVTTAGGSDVNSNDLLGTIKYPDKSSGSAGSGTSYAEAFTYNATGDRTSYTDRNGSIHKYSYDVLGRVMTDNVTTLGSGVDGGVRRFDYAYDTSGRLFQLTSRSGTNSTSTVVNQVQREYNGYGQMTTEYQEVSGAVGNFASVRVGYTYNEGGSGDTPTDNNSRATSIIYPSQRVVNYVYSSVINDRISRLDEPTICGGLGGTLESYYYLGLDTVVQRDRQQEGVKMTYIKQGTESVGDAGDQYTGLDRFGRVVDQRWVKYSGTNITSTLDEFKYAYDRDSNPLYKKNEVSSSFSELYHTNGTNSAGYDNLNRLTDFRRGTLSDADSNGVYDTVTTTNALAGSQKNWGLDAVGNWNSSQADGTTTTRTTNSQNQVTAVGANSLVFDFNGNTTTDETGKQFVYDAWNRLKVVKNTGGTTIQSYGYDALGRRTSESAGGTHFYYSSAAQVIEERTFSGEDYTTKSQYVWSPLYVDDLIVRDSDADSNSATGSYGMFNSGLEQRVYAQNDANWNVTSLADPSGSVIQRFAYDPYGAATVLTSAWATTTDGYNWVVRHQGGRYDSITGLIRHGVRDFSATLGRWMQQDPARYIDGASLYGFEEARPTSCLDPTGLAATEPTRSPTDPTKCDRLKELEGEIEKTQKALDEYVKSYQETAKEFQRQDTDPGAYDAERRAALNLIDQNYIRGQLEALRDELKFRKSGGITDSKLKARIEEIERLQKGYEAQLKEYRSKYQEYAKYFQNAKATNEARDYQRLAQGMMMNDTLLSGRLSELEREAKRIRDELKALNPTTLPTTLPTDTPC